MQPKPTLSLYQLTSLFIIKLVNLKVMLKHKKALLALLLVTCLVVSQLPLKSQALHLQNHSVKISTAQINATASHNFTFDYPSASVVGSVVLQYCDAGALLPMPCNAPAGLDLTGAVLVSQSGNIGFSIDVASSTVNKIVLTRAPIAGAAVTSTYNFDNIVNPSTPNATTYVRISTYSTIDGTGPDNDDGAVAFATVSPFEVGAFVPPFLKLCVGIVVSNDCSSIAGDSIDLGNLSTSGPKFGTSQFSVGTNSAMGYNIFTLGTTMTSGNNAVSAINPSGVSRPGTSQFGLNLRANTNPAVGADPQGAGTGAPQTDYGTSNLFKYQNGDNIASSSLPTDFSKMTVSYLVNINSAQPPGVYATTVTYLGVADF
jgi:hypothetical protein